MSHGEVRETILLGAPGLSRRTEEKLKDQPKPTSYDEMTRIIDAARRARSVNKTPQLNEGEK